MKHRARNRILSFFLALVMLCTSAPFPVNSVEIGGQDSSTTDANYGKYICCSAKFNLEYYATFLVYTHPAEFDYNGSDGEFDYDTIDGDGSDWDNDAYWLSDQGETSDLLESHLFVITNYYYDEQTTALWYKVEAAPGYELPSKMAANGYAWVFQNFTDVYADEGWEEYAPDALIVQEDGYVFSEKKPAYIVSNSGITVSSGSAALTELEITETEAPSDYYIDKAIAYNMIPKTTEGNYTGHAEITIPIPEGWDESLVYGFVVEKDGSITSIPGAVTKQGTFRFTVPHFSEVGLFQARSAVVVTGQTVTLEVGQTTAAIEVTGTAVDGEYWSDAGCVAYSIWTEVQTAYTGDKLVEQNQVFTFLGVDITGGATIVIGDVTYTVIVKEAAATVNKLVIGTGSITLDAFYDLAIRQEWYSVSFEETKDDEDVIALDTTTGQVTGKGKDSTTPAEVTATVTHKESGDVVAKVTYLIDTSTKSIADTQNVYVPKDGTVSITMPDTITTFDQSMLDTNIATVGQSGNTITITGISESGQTAVIVNDTRFVIYAEPENPEKTSQNKIYFKPFTITNTTIYYAINGGDLHKLDGSSILVGLNNGTTQNFPDGFNIMIFSAPNDGYATTTYSGDGVGDFYALGDGVLHDGSDSTAWPFTDADANYDLDDSTVDIPAMPGNGSTAWKSTQKTDSDGNVTWSQHGFRWPLIEGNMTINEMRDLFSRALALGCDSVINFTKNASNDFQHKNLNVVAEQLPTLSKKITHYKKEGSDTWLEYTDGVKLQIGDTLRYTFTITHYSSNITLSDIKIVDTNLPQTGDGDGNDNQATITVDFDDFTDNQYSTTLEYTLTNDHIHKYAGGEFWNSAVMYYSYASINRVSVGSSVTQVKASVKCDVESVVTWTDEFKNIWKVENILQDSYVTTANMPKPEDVTLTGYILTGWKIDGVDTHAGWIIDTSGNYVGSDYQIPSPDPTIIMAQWEAIQYKITYDLDGGSLPGNMDNPQEYTIETKITLPTPTKPGHDFAGWVVVSDNEGTWVKGDAFNGGAYMVRRHGNVTLQAQWIVHKHTVTWKNHDGTVLETDVDVPYGTMPEYNGATPTKPGNDQYTYEFIGWTPTVSAITGDVTYTATFNKTLKQYTITFKNEDGSVLQESKWDYGSTPVYQGETPIKAPTDALSFTFAGWTPAITTVTGDATYTATYISDTRTYTVTWKHPDGHILKTDTVAYGDTPSYVGDTPTKDADAQYEYVFKGWTPEIVPVTGDVVYTATFDPILQKYTVIWQNDDGTLLEKDENVEYGTMPSYDSKVPEKTPTVQYTYVFDGWTTEVSVVTGDVTYTAKYREVLNSYTVTFIDEDGQVLQSSDWQYGANPSYNGTVPTKAGDAQYSYTFVGWDVEIAPVTGNATYKAVYTQTVNKYTIQFVNEDGTVLQSSEWEYGSTPSYTGATPTKNPTKRYTYTFKDWSPEIVPVTGAATYTATYHTDDKLASNHKIYIGVNLSYHVLDDVYEYPYDGRRTENAYHKLPDEPCELYHKALRAYLKGSEWVVESASDDNPLPYAPEFYIDPAIFEDPAYKDTLKTTGASGIFDASGVNVEEYVKLPAGYKEGIIKAWIDAYTNSYVSRTDVVWSNYDVEDCELVPYVVKYQSNGNWYIDMVVQVKEAELTIEAQGEPDHIFLFEVSDGIHSVIVAVPGGSAVTIRGMIYDKEYTVKELTSWSWEHTFVSYTNAAGSTIEITPVEGRPEAKIKLVNGLNRLVAGNTYTEPDWLEDETSKDNNFGTYTP